ncbi:MAG: NusA-like transcription termination signal-binding factor [Candidatus Woesearchaeota archaeon]
MKYDVELLQIMSLFEKITRTKLKDALFFKEKLVFIVPEGNLAKALGKNKANVEKIEKAINRKIKIVEFSSDKLRFIKNVMSPLKILEISEVDGVVTIKGPDQKTKGLMIGSRAQNLRAYEEIVKKYYDLEEIKVI